MYIGPAGGSDVLQAGKRAVGSALDGKFIS